MPKEEIVSKIIFSFIIKEKRIRRSKEFHKENYRRETNEREIKIRKGKATLREI